MATNGQFCWPSVGSSVAACGQFGMAANIPGHHASPARIEPSLFFKNVVSALTFLGLSLRLLQSDPLRDRQLGPMPPLASRYLFLQLRIVAGPSQDAIATSLIGFELEITSQHNSSLIFWMNHLRDADMLLSIPAAPSSREGPPSEILEADQKRRSGQRGDEGNVLVAEVPHNQGALQTSATARSR